jgi:hypothetical protein
MGFLANENFPRASVRRLRDMDRRLSTLEGWRERQEGENLEAVRKLLERLSLQRSAKSSA